MKTVCDHFTSVFMNSTHHCVLLSEADLTYVSKHFFLQSQFGLWYSVFMRNDTYRNRKQSLNVYKFMDHAGITDHNDLL